MPRIALALAAVLVAAVAAGSAGARPATPSAPIVFGYPYANRCPGAGIAQVVDRWHMFACNCTSYVAWALTANGQRTDWFVPGAMDAWNWPNVARLAHLRVDRVPEVGAVAVWPGLAKPYGHVAYVANVDGHGRFDVAEYNEPVLGSVETWIFDQRTDVDSRGAVFIHVPRRDGLRP